MKKWQENRNYRQIRNRAGNIIASIIIVDGMDVEVPEDVYQAYAQADRRERYLLKERSVGKSLSLEQMEEDDLLPGYAGAEEIALERERAQELVERKQVLLLAMLVLSNADRELITALRIFLALLCCLPQALCRDTAGVMTAG